MERNPGYAEEIRALVHFDRVASTGRSAEGIPLFDEDLVLAAASVSAAERSISASGAGVRSSAHMRAVQYRDAADLLVKK
jgi:hypothetical protein